MSRSNAAIIAFWVVFFILVFVVFVL